jgi:hypothetical protein
MVVLGGDGSAAAGRLAVVFLDMISLHWLQSIGSQWAWRTCLLITASIHVMVLHAPIAALSRALMCRPWALVPMCSRGIVADQSYGRAWRGARGRGCGSEGGLAGKMKWTRIFLLFFYPFFYIPISEFLFFCFF